MNKSLSLKDLKVEIIGGQIMSRVKAESEEQVFETKRVMVPKAIRSDGTVDISELPEEKLKVAADDKRVTKTGDIVIKLSTPYDAALIEDESAGCIVPSFCAIIRHCDNIDKRYLLAFLNSSYCKDQLKQQVAGALMTVLSVGKVGNVMVPFPSADEQYKIGVNYFKTQEKLKIIKQIIELEAKKNDVIFKELVKSYE